jgi:multidrug transporter EmrE-like cation transporter
MRFAVSACTYTALSATGIILLRQALAAVPNPSLHSVLAQPLVIVGGTCYAISFLIFAVSLRRFDVLTVYPVFTGLAYATVAAAAFAILHEALTPTRLVGVALVGVGVVLLAR